MKIDIGVVSLPYHNPPRVADRPLFRQRVSLSYDADHGGSAGRLSVRRFARSQARLQP